MLEKIQVANLAHFVIWVDNLSSSKWTQQGLQMYTITLHQDQEIKSAKLSILGICVVTFQ